MCCLRAVSRSVLKRPPDRPRSVIWIFRCAVDDLDECAQLAGDGLIHLLGSVLIDQRGTRAVLTHPCHEVLGADVNLRGERIACVLEIVEVQTRPSDCGDCLLPPGE